jgi:non-ribosomal peptide synthetase component F
MIGFFINQLVLRTSLRGDPQFCELLARVRKTSIDAFAWQELPFDKLVEALRPERSLSHAQLFQVKLVLQNTPPSALELPSGLSLSTGGVPVAGAPAREDLLIDAVERPPGFLLTFKYNADLFGAPTIARMADTFERILRRVIAEPEVRLSELDQMLDEADRAERARQAQVHAHSMARRLKTRSHHRMDDVKSLGEII